MATVLGRFSKQPGETLDYDVDFTDWFSNRTDTPSSFTATADAGITVVGSSISGNIVKVVLGGGDSGSRYKITVALTTTAAIVKEADFIVAVKEV